MAPVEASFEYIYWEGASTGDNSQIINAEELIVTSNLSVKDLSLFFFFFFFVN